MEITKTKIRSFPTWKIVDAKTLAYVCQSRDGRFGIGKPTNGSVMTAFKFETLEEAATAAIHQKRSFIKNHIVLCTQ